MTYTVRTKDNAGVAGRSADQNESVDNDKFFKDILENDHVIRRIISADGLVDNVATEIFTITTANETNDTDAGVYAVKLHGVVAHGPLSTTIGAPACKGFGAQWCRAVRNTGWGISSIVLENLETGSGASIPATKDIAAVTLTLVETSEYVISVQLQVDLSGDTIGTAECYFMVELVWDTFTTQPVIA